MIRKKCMKIFMIVTVFVILFNCLYSSSNYNRLLETYSNCDSEKYYKALDDLEDEVDNINKQFKKKESDMEKSITFLHKKTAANLKEAKKAADQSKNIQKEKASPDKMSKLNKENKKNK